MDLDAYVVQHSLQWDRLQTLTRQSRRLTGAEADEVIDLYQRTATHLSVVRSSAADPVLEARLSTLVAGARSVVTGVNVPLLSAVARFFVATFPAAVYRCRYWWIGTAVVALLISVLIAVRVIADPGLANSVADPDQIKQLINHDFASYYRDNPAGDFAFEVWVNNAKVAALCLITGVAIVPVLIGLMANQENLGLIGGLMIGAGRSDLFFGLILPHGLLELTVVYVAAGAGLRLGWSWIAPGRRTRARALAQEGRAAGAMALGLGVWLLISGAVEAFVTPSPLPAWARIGIGALVWAAFLTYVFWLGRRAVSAGETGDVRASALDATVPTEAA